MSTLNDENVWVDKIYQLDEDTPVLGGPGGPDNRQAQQLANRTLWLKFRLENISGDLSKDILDALSLDTGAGMVGTSTGKPLD
ncbi:tail fiber protein, partial [Salmonella enterica]|nr:tail fiber protein [Salmonella enterica]